jgi:sugar phosphate isomerase/epimerase
MNLIKPHVHVPYERLWNYLDIILAEGFNVELFLNGGNLDSLTPQKIDELSTVLSPVPALSIHGPFMDLSPGGVDGRVREATLSRFSQTLEVAEALKPRTVVFHSGYEKWKYALKPDIWLEQSLKTWCSIARRAQDIGVKIAIENIFEDEPGNLRMLMDALDDPTFGICFDTGHCNLFTKVSQGEWLEVLGQYIIELHLHDNMKDRDAHLPMGDGSFDFPELFRSVSSDDIVHTIEAHSLDDVRTALARFEELAGQKP